MRHDTFAKPTASPARPLRLPNMHASAADRPFRKAGKFPIYSRDDLDAWANQRLGKLVHSTSELVDRGALPCMGRRSPCRCPNCIGTATWPDHATAMACERATARNRRCASCQGDGRSGKTFMALPLATVLRPANRLRDEDQALRWHALHGGRSLRRHSDPVAGPREHPAFNTENAASVCHGSMTCQQSSDPGALECLVELARRGGGGMQAKFGMPLALIVIDTMAAAAGFQR